MTQRELDEEMGISLGKANHSFKVLAEKSWVKVGNSSRDKNKLGYAYLLTNWGLYIEGTCASALKRK